MTTSRRLLRGGGGCLWVRGGGSLSITLETLNGTQIDISEDDLLPLFSEWLSSQLISKLEAGQMDNVFEWLRCSQNSGVADGGAT